MTTLTKKYWVRYQGNEILNEDYKDEQSGFCNVGAGIESAEFDTLEELELFVSENGLILKQSEYDY